VRSLSKNERIMMAALLSQVGKGRRVFGPRWLSKILWPQAARRRPKERERKAKVVLAGLSALGLAARAWDAEANTYGWCLTPDGYRQATEEAKGVRQ